MTADQEMALNWAHSVLNDPNETEHQKDRAARVIYRIEGEFDDGEQWGAEVRDSSL